MLRVAVFVLTAALAGITGAAARPPAPLLTYFLTSPFAAPGGGGLCAVESGRAIRLTNPGNEQGPAWSPDGAHVALFRSNAAGADSDVWTSNADGGDLRRLTSHYAVWNQDPSWSPDDKTIVFASRNDRGRLVLMAPDGSDKRELAGSVTAVYGVDGTPTWSPDGRSIAFSRTVYQPEVSGTYVISADGGTPRLIAAGAYTPDWSPDGREIAMTTEHAIVVANSDGTGLHVVRVQPPWPVQAMGNPKWSPDGKQIAFTEVDVLREQVWLMNADGSHARPVAGDRDLGATGPAWRPSAPLPHDVGRPCIERGSSRDDVLVGTNRGDVIVGEAGNDVIKGRGGPDLILGGPGRDRLYGGPGNDWIYARDGEHDLVDGGPGNDHAITDSKGDTIRSIEDRRAY